VTGMGKRVFDLAVAGLGLLVLAPLLLLAAAWIKLDSPGPVLYRQERVGRGGRVFRIHKLRTMQQSGAQPGPLLTAQGDPRITRAGRFLRRHRVDEWPQLIDVLAGHMSLVGPRPEVPRYVALYPPQLRDEVLAVRPGITDPASLEFANEAEHLAQSMDPERAYIEELMPRKLACQAAYARQATLASDIVVLGRTLRWLFAR